MGIFNIYTQVKIQILSIGEYEVKIMLTTGTYDGGLLIDGPEKVEVLTMEAGEEKVVS